jgi:hypothetical protein
MGVHARIGILNVIKKGRESKVEIPPLLVSAPPGSPSRHQPSLKSQRLHERREFPIEMIIERMNDSDAGGMHRMGNDHGRQSHERRTQRKEKASSARIRINRVYQ